MSETGQLMPQRMHLAEHERTAYVVTVESHTSRELLKEPSFWSLVAKKFRPYDRLEVRSDDGTFWAEYLVLACDRTWAKVHEMSFHKLTTSEIAQTQAAIQNDEFEVKWGGPHNKFRVIRKSDNAVIKDQIQTKDDADLALKEYVKVIK